MPLKLALALILALLSRSAAAQEAPPKKDREEKTVLDHGALDRILARHVRGVSFDYEGLRARSTADLDAYLKLVRTTKPELLEDADEKTAFLVNAYNAWVLRKVLDTRPERSVLDEKGFFEKADVLVGGKRMSLNALEKLARDLGDPRVHFVVNCASTSCPPLLGRALTGKTLEKELNAATRAYLADAKHGLRPSKNGKSVRLSKIFEWYAKDFDPSGKPEKVLAWIRKQAPKDLAKKLEAVEKIDFLDYDWSLNDPPEKRR